MHFNYSEELPPADNPTGGLAGTLAVRQHRHGRLEDIGAVRAQMDWSALVSPIQNFKGGMAHKYGLMQVAVPECLPDRLEIIAYASEVGFLYDDCTELFNNEQLARENDRMQSAFGEGVRNGSIDSQEGGLKAMQSKLFKEMMAIDTARAMVAMKVWVEFLQEAAGRQHDAIHASFDSYMAYRVLDVGEMFWFGLVTFGMALSIPESEIPRLRELTRVCWVVLALQNDICSYNKEVQAAQLKGATHVVNALWFLMKDHGIDLEGARTLCRQHINRHVVEYVEIVNSHRDDPSLSQDTRTYMESLLCTISGDAAWSLITPRYNPDQVYNEQQLQMLSCRGADLLTQGTTTSNSLVDNEQRALTAGTEANLRSKF